MGQSYIVLFTLPFSFYVYNYLVLSTWSFQDLWWQRLFTLIPLKAPSTQLNTTTSKTNVLYKIQTHCILYAYKLIVIVYYNPYIMTFHIVLPTKYYCFSLLLIFLLHGFLLKKAFQQFPINLLYLKTMH